MVELQFLNWHVFTWDKSIVGNTCAQIYTGGKFVHINTMKYKSEFGMSLEKLNQDVNAANEIFIDNLPEWTGYNDEI